MSRAGSGTPCRRTAWRMTRLGRRIKAEAFEWSDRRERDFRFPRKRSARAIERQLALERLIAANANATRECNVLHEEREPAQTCPPDRATPLCSACSEKPQGRMIRRGWSTRRGAGRRDQNAGAGSSGGRQGHPSQPRTAHRGQRVLKGTKPHERWFDQERAAHPDPRKVVKAGEW
jgi:hypothetical protein